MKEELYSFLLIIILKAVLSLHLTSDSLFGTSLDFIMPLAPKIINFICQTTDAIAGY